MNVEQEAAAQAIMSSTSTSGGQQPATASTSQQSIPPSSIGRTVRRTRTGQSQGNLMRILDNAIISILIPLSLMTGTVRALQAAHRARPDEYVNCADLGVEKRSDLPISSSSPLQVKCDEAKPNCGACLRLGLGCQWPATFRFSRGSRSTGEIPMSRRRWTQIAV